jgi:tartrate dehydratase beta subunit/fumarate hydratase class I family protein
MTKLNFHFSKEKIRALKASDKVLLSGVGFVGRIDK